MTQDSIAEQRDIPIQHHGIAKNDVIQDLNKEVDRMKDQMARLTARLERSEAEIRRLRKENCAASSASGTFGEKLERRSTPPLAKAHQTRSTQTKQGKAYGRGHRLTMVNGRYAGMHHHPQWRSLVRSIPQTGRNLNWETLHKLVVSHFDPHWPKARTQAFKQAGGEMAIDVCYDIQQDSKDARGTWTTLRKRVRLEAIQKFEDLCADHFPLELFADAWAAKQILTYTWNNMRPKKNNTSSESDSNEGTSCLMRIVFMFLLFVYLSKVYMVMLLHYRESFRSVRGNQSH